MLVMFMSANLGGSGSVVAYSSITPSSSKSSSSSNIRREFFFASSELSNFFLESVAEVEPATSVHGVLNELVGLNFGDKTLLSPSRKALEKLELRGVARFLVTATREFSFHDSSSSSTTSRSSSKGSELYAKM